MIFFDQMFYSIKRIIIDIKPIALRLLSFAIIILILGSAFSSSFSPVSLDKVNILYCNNDEGDLGDVFLNNMLESSEISELMTFEKVESKEAGEKFIKKGHGEGLIYIAQGFSEATLEGGGHRTIDVYLKDSTGLNAIVIKNVINTFVNFANTAGVIYRETGSFNGFDLENTVSVKSEPLSNTSTPNAMGYYSVAMLLMLILYGADYGRAGIGEDYLGSLGDRMKLSPISSFSQYMGKTIGLAFVTFAQGICIILFTKFAFHVNWGNQLGMILVILFSYSILATVFGAMLSVVTGDLKKADSLVTIGILIFTFLAGGFVAIDFGIATNFSPSYYARNAIFNVVYNGNLHVAWINVGIIWCIAFAFIGIGVAAARRKSI